MYIGPEDEEDEEGEEDEEDGDDGFEDDDVRESNRDYNWIIDGESSRD